MKELIEFYTKTGANVLDPFAGVGGTLLGASICEPGARLCVGIELNPTWIEIYHQVLALPECSHVAPQDMIQGDCLEVMHKWSKHGIPFNIDGFDLIITDPPYTVQLKQTMSGKAGGEAYLDKHANRRSDYNMFTDDDRDFANCETYADYLLAMHAFFRWSYELLKPGKYLVYIVRDNYSDGAYNFAAADLARQAADVGFVPKGDKIWYQVGSKLRPYGYPNAYVPNIVTQHIVTLQKPRTKKAKKSAI